MEKLNIQENKFYTVIEEINGTSITGECDYDFRQETILKIVEVEKELIICEEFDKKGNTLAYDNEDDVYETWSFDRSEFETQVKEYKK